MDYQELRRIAGRDAWELIPGYEQTAHPGTGKTCGTVSTTGWPMLTTNSLR